MTRTPPTSTLFPYTTLFRSGAGPSPSATAPRRPGRARPAPPAAVRTGRPRGPGPGGPYAAPSAVVSGNGGIYRGGGVARSEEHTSELQSQFHLVCRLLLEKK